MIWIQKSLNAHLIQENLYTKEAFLAIFSEETSVKVWLEILSRVISLYS